ncbi:RNA polymerase sigma factor [Myxococcus sp. CA051A]|uniref:RNA polymerase sigma factor n=1 Tax=unclassified Myxococcus TaxID=2648731 RepID=UPI00157ADCAF|nr:MULTISPECIES: RNA polymerase sigma factor [unclassified Myxococcus]NTX34324.1 RNA polymerase sigma factor [Myxococcus sp. CA033]NTX57199.1 RNA polymerase sigma factor [Myxococcus sp. CA039A]NTX60848.1 RNA polymerase sigma factor [Myxococcus sp. CA051A]
MSFPPARRRIPAGAYPPCLELSELYLRHGRALRQRARALLGGVDESEDVLQDVFLAMLASPELHRGEASVFTLLSQMVTHKALDRYRARARRLVWHARLGSEARSDDGGESLQRVEAARDLRWMVRSTPAQVLTAARLHFVEGHTQGEVAEVLGVSRKTVVRLLKRLWVQARC